MLWILQAVWGFGPPLFHSQRAFVLYSGFLDHRLLVHDDAVVTTSQGSQLDGKSYFEVRKYQDIVTIK